MSDSTKSTSTKIVPTMSSSRGFLRTSGTSIVDDRGKPVHLRGVNFGGWLMMEAYFMHAPNTAERLMKTEFAKKLGNKALADLEKAFRGNFIQEEDMKQVAAWGFNAVRLPFNCRLIETAPYKYSKAGLKYLDDAISWGKKYGVYMILDLHAAPGCQNHDWHSDSLGKAELWSSKEYRNRTYALWEMLADRYKDETAVAGYDLVNEPVLEKTAVLNELYRGILKAIRQSDKNHMLFIEGTRWSQDIECLDEVKDDNWLYSIHFYEPIEYTFNFTPHLRYPIKSPMKSTLKSPQDLQQGVWDINTTRKRLESYATFTKSRGRPVHVGEFGVNYREGLYNEDKYVKDVVKCFKDFGFHWNYWTYKAVKHYMFPDGIYSYYPNPVWVHRVGPVTGWDRWKDVWPKHKKDMAASWPTTAFTLNDKVLTALKTGCV